MADTLGEFHTLVSTELKRGTTLDSLIPAATKRAARWIERNHTLQYMQRFVSFFFDISSAQPRAITLPESRVKSILFIRIVEDDGGYSYITRGDARDIGKTETGKPGLYWVKAFDNIWFDKKPDKNYLCEMLYSRYTTWPTDTTAAPWLLLNAEDVLLARTIRFLAGPGRFTRDFIGNYAALEAEGLKTLLLADDETKFDGANQVMNFGAIY